MKKNLIFITLLSGLLIGFLFTGCTEDFEEINTDDIFVASSWPTYVAFSKKRVSKEYVEKFNDALVGMKADGTYRTLLDKYSD